MPSSTFFATGQGNTGMRVVISACCTGGGGGISDGALDSFEVMSKF